MHPMHPMLPNLYQWFLISTHSQRHIMQIREVKARQDFPTK